MTEKEAYLLSLKLWIWLYKNPGKGKEDSPYWEEINRFYYACPLCEYCLEDKGPNCSNCIDDFSDGCFGKAWGSWRYYNNDHAAAYIASKIRRACVKKGFIKKGMVRCLIK